MQPRSNESANPLTARAVIRRVRMRKEDSAFFYALMESYEGIAAYSTLDSPPDTPHRDLELQVPPDFVIEVDNLLSELKDWVYVTS